MYTMAPEGYILFRSLFLPHITTRDFPVQIMKKNNKKENDEVKVHLLKNGLYADRNDVINHPSTLRQFEELQKIVDRYMRPAGGKKE